MDERGYAYLIGWSTDFSRPGQASTDCSVVHTAGYSSHPATRQRRHPTPWLLLPLRRRWRALPPFPLLYHRAHTRTIHTYAHIHGRNTKFRSRSGGILAKNCKRFVYGSLARARARAFICHQKMLIAIFRFRLIERVCLFFPRSPGRTSSRLTLSRDLL